MEIAFDQAEDQWESNIGWLVDSKRRSISMQKLQEWNWVRQLARRRVLASGLAAALFDEASKTTQVARVTAKFKKKMAAKSSAQESPSQNSLAPPSVAEGAGASAEEGAGVSSPISPEAAHPASQHDDNHMEMHRIISRARSTNGSSTSALNADKALLQSAQPSAAKTTTLGPMALRALRRIESAAIITSLLVGTFSILCQTFFDHSIRLGGSSRIGPRLGRLAPSRVHSTHPSNNEGKPKIVNALQFLLEQLHTCVNVCGSAGRGSDSRS